MAGLVPAIHVFGPSRKKKDVDARAFASPKGLRPRRRDKPGHDNFIVACRVPKQSCGSPFEPPQPDYPNCYFLPL
jgi:hypothetical protein